MSDLALILRKDLERSIVPEDNDSNFNQIQDLWDQGAVGSRWSLSGSDIYYNTGRVGVGISGGFLGAIHVRSASRIMHLESADTTKKFVVDANGFVGMNITPFYPLQIYSNETDPYAVFTRETTKHCGFGMRNSESLSDTNRFWIVGKRANTESFGIWNFDGSGDTIAITAIKTGEVGINNTSPLSQIHVKSRAPTVITSILQAAASQTVNVQEFRDSSGVVKLYIDSDLNGLYSSGDLYLGASNTLRSILSNTALMPWINIDLGQNNTTNVHWKNYFATGDIHLTNGVASSGTKEATAKLQVDSTTKGVLTPRMTTAEFAAIATKAKGLEAFSNSDNGKLWYDGTRIVGYRYTGTAFEGYNGTAWVSISVSRTIGAFNATGSQLNTIAMSNEWYKVVLSGQATLKATSDIAISTNRITYTGSVSKQFRVSFSTILALSSITSDKKYFFSVQKNATSAPNGIAEVFFKVATSPSTTVSRVDVFTLAQNDYLELFVNNLTDTTGIYVAVATLIIDELI